MPHVYPAAAALQRKDPIGDGECVTLIRTLTPSLKDRPTSSWKQGARVLGNKDVKPGTAIANFVNGKWPGLNKGNHAAFYLRQDHHGIWVIDQWVGKSPIASHSIPSRGVRKDGSYPLMSDNADAFFVIE
jgi:hypothetical protein